MRVIIDRFEGDFAVCEKDDRSILNINRRDLPSDAKEGDVLNVDGYKINIDTDETAKRKEMARLLAENVWDANNKI